MDGGRTRKPEEAASTSHVGAQQGVAARSSSFMRWGARLGHLQLPAAHRHARRRVKVQACGHRSYGVDWGRLEGGCSEKRGARRVAREGKGQGLGFAGVAVRSPRVWLTCLRCAPSPRSSRLCHASFTLSRRARGRLRCCSSPLGKLLGHAVWRPPGPALWPPVRPAPLTIPPGASPAAACASRCHCSLRMKRPQVSLSTCMAATSCSVRERQREHAGAAHPPPCPAPSERTHGGGRHNRCRRGRKVKRCTGGAGEAGRSARPSRSHRSRPARGAVPVAPAGGGIA